MRTKDVILTEARADITDPNYPGKEPFWLKYLELEVLIDIRDVIYEAGTDIQDAIWKTADKD
jgi:hypothetical protein